MHVKCKAMLPGLPQHSQSDEQTLTAGSVNDNDRKYSHTMTWLLNLHVKIYTIKCQPWRKANHENAFFYPHRMVDWRRTFSKAAVHTPLPFSPPLFYSVTVIIVPYDAPPQTWLGCRCGLFPHVACRVYIRDSSPRHSLQGPSMWDTPLRLSRSVFSWTLRCHCYNSSLVSGADAFSFHVV